MSSNTKVLELATKAILGDAFLSGLGPSHPDEEVLTLISNDWDEPEPLMARIVVKLRHRDARATADLLQAARGEAVGAYRVDTRGQAIAVETLAAARVPALEPGLREILFDLFRSPEGHLRFVAVAACSDLSNYGKAVLKWTVAELASTDTSEAVRAAAAAFVASTRAPERAARDQNG